MNESCVLITYSEIALKSPPVRKRLETCLIRDIKKMLNKKDLGSSKVRRIQGRLIIEKADPVKASEVASQIFGVVSAMPALKVDNDLDAIIKVVIELSTKVIQNNQTFAIRAKRIGSQSYKSKDIEVRGGATVLEHLSKKGVKVNLEKPDKTIYVEAREDAAYIYHQLIPGFNGLPFGSQGKLISLFSGGIDSPVATWLMMKRGALVIPLFLDQRPYVEDDYFSRAENVVKKIREYVPLNNYYLNVIPIGEIMEEIVSKIPTKFICIVCKRMMYRIACDLAEIKKADGIITGENLGQVASQTLTNLKVIDEVSPLPVYRPLISFEKNDIVKLAKKIGTYDLSIAKACGCKVVPLKPATKAGSNNIKKFEEALDIQSLISSSLARITKISL